MPRPGDHASSSTGALDADGMAPMRADARRTSAGDRTEFRPNLALEQESDRGHGVGSLIEAHPDTAMNLGIGPGAAASAWSQQPSSSMWSLDSSGSCMNGALSDVESSLGFGMHTEDFPARLPALRQIPDCFKCPISQQLFEDPVLLDDGRTYDRSSVGSMVYQGEIRPSSAMKEAVEGYLELLEDMERRQQDWLSHAAMHEQRMRRRLVQKKKQVFALRTLLDHSRRRAEELTRGSRKSTAFSSASAASSAPSTAATLSASSSGASTSSAAADDEEEQLRQQLEQRGRERQEFKCGPAPRSTKAGAAPARRQMRSAWSRILSGRLAGVGGA